MIDIKNAAPMVIDQGIKDLSTTVKPESSLISPQHLPKFYIFAETGPLGSNFIDLGEDTLTNLYGDETFNVEGKYYTHQTPFLQAVASAGNNCVVHRLSADDAKDNANITLYLDVLPCQVPLYQKYSDGSLILDSVTGQPLTVKDSNNDDITVAGYKACWVSDYTVATIGQYEVGRRPIRPGIQSEGGVQSQQYPIFEVRSEHPGEYGNKIAVRIYNALQTDNYPFPSNFLNDTKVYPYYFQVVKLLDNSSGKTMTYQNGYGSLFSRFSSKKGSIDPTSGLVVDFTKTITDQYVNKSFAGSTGVGEVHSYFDNIETVLGMFYTSEKIVSDSYRDTAINNSVDNRHCFNFIGFTSSNGSPYQSVKQVNVAGSVRLTKNSNQFLKGSNDGTMSEALLDQLVADDMEYYNSPTSDYNDLVLHPESIIYDTGFTLTTKKVLPKFIARRKDTFVVLSTYAHNNQASLVADQYSLAVALKTMLELYPESDVWSTPVTRGMIIGGSGKIKGSPYLKRVPTSYEVAYKASRYMGSSTGAWKNGYAFDKAPLSVISQLYDIDNTWVPAVTRNAMWAVGLNFPLNYKIKSQFFPALQTVYENDTSVLNSFFTAVAISYLNKIGHAAWREFSGTISYTNAQLEEAVTSYVASMVKDKFDGKFVVIPECKVTEEDALRGYSFNLTIKIYSPNMKTVMVSKVESYRIESLNTNI